jgi:hypothetical protein
MLRHWRVAGQFPKHNLRAGSDAKPVRLRDRGPRAVGLGKHGAEETAAAGRLRLGE